MSVLFIVLPLALVVVLAAVVAFLWGARRGQFDDLETPALRMLHDDEPPADGSGAPPRLTVVRRSDPPAT
jgi:cbb3-type cytochrome oxidase maturation protein